jgi:hypothetical protein
MRFSILIRRARLDYCLLLTLALCSEMLHKFNELRSHAEEVTLKPNAAMPGADKFSQPCIEPLRSGRALAAIDAVWTLKPTGPIGPE